MRFFQPQIIELAQKGFFGNFFDFINQPQDVDRFVGNAEIFQKAAQKLTVVDIDFESRQLQLAEYRINHRQNFRVINNIQLVAVDNVDIALIKFAEPAFLRAFAAVYLADLITFERKGQFIVVKRNIFGQRHRQVKTHGNIGVTFFKLVNLFFRLAAGF